MSDGEIVGVQGPSAPSPVSRCPLRAITEGTWRFTLLSVVAFSLWAFAGRWFYRTVGEAGLYAATAVVFAILAALLLSPLLHGNRSFLRLYKIFVPAFLVYSITWCLFWFWQGFGLGEWLGSFVGSLVFGAVTARMFRGVTWQKWLMGSGVFFITHSLGYFLGGKLMHALGSLKDSAIATGSLKGALPVLAKLSWGVLYGAGFGAGLGYMYELFQRKPDGIATSDSRSGSRIDTT